jgi:His/Glu/Gln/Arg/opine family amino acid ABC transporter permease subunit
MTSFAFLEQLWIARYVIMTGLATTVSISLLAIVAGSLFGVLVGLALVYGGRVLRFIVRAYTDIIRGTPVLVLVLASYYVSAAAGVDLGPFSAGVLALAVFCSSHIGFRPFRRGRPRRPRRSASPSARPSPRCSGRRPCASACRPGSTRRPRW